MDKTYINISTNEEKACDKIQHCSMIKPLNKLGIEGIFFNLIKDIYEKSVATIKFNG